MDIKCLLMQDENSYYIIRKIDSEIKKYYFQLNNLGITIGKKIILKKFSYLKESILIQVDGILIAMDKILAKNIYVEKCLM